MLSGTKPSLQRYSNCTTVPVPVQQVHDLQPGDKVLMKVFSHKSELEVRMGAAIYCLIKFLLCYKGYSEGSLDPPLTH